MMPIDHQDICERLDRLEEQFESLNSWVENIARQLSKVVMQSQDNPLAKIAELKDALAGLQDVMGEVQPDDEEED